MSLWTDLQNKSIGKNIRKEDLADIYYPDGEGKITLKSGEYRSAEYKIITDGLAPGVYIKFNKRTLAPFVGTSIIILNLNNKEYRLFNDANLHNTSIVYVFDKPGDYVTNQQEGKKYTVNELENISKQFIDELIKCENEFIKNA